MERTKEMNLLDYRIPQGYRLWHFISDRKLSELELEKASNEIRLFLNSWNAHGRMLSAKHFWLYDQILSIALDVQKGNSSGCSIDSMKKFTDYLASEFGFQWQPNNLFHVLKDNKIHSLSRKEFIASYEMKSISGESRVFDSLMLDSTANSGYLFPKLMDSWHSKLI